MSNNVALISLAERSPTLTLAECSGNGNDNNGASPIGKPQSSSIFASTLADTDRTFQQLEKDFSWVQLGFSDRAHRFSVFTFVVLGVATLSFWWTVITTLDSVQTFLYPNEPNMYRAFTVSYVTANAFIIAIILCFDLVHVNFLFVGLGSLLLAEGGLWLIYPLAKVIPITHSQSNN